MNSKPIEICLLKHVQVTFQCEGTVCKLDTDCGADECCYIRPQFLVASKRQSILPVLQPQHDTGVCEKYRLEHDFCGPLETANGHCGCGKGMSCQFVPDPTLALLTASPDLVVSKRSIFMHGPGSYQCEMI
ncbi:hypothetical protein ACF0H5_005041 [Mactra antiquata]